MLLAGLRTNVLPCAITLAGAKVVISAEIVQKVGAFLRNAGNYQAVTQKKMHTPPMSVQFHNIRLHFKMKTRNAWNYQAVT